MKIFLTGDSHLAALGAGYKAMQAENDPALNGVDFVIRPLGNGGFMSEPFFEDAGSYALITHPEFKKYIGRIPAAGEDFDWIGVCGPFLSARIYRHRAWSNYSPTFEPNKAPITPALLRQISLDDIAQQMALLDLLLREGYKVFVFEGPHLFRHTPALQNMGSEMVRAIDATHRSVVREELARRPRIRVVDIPDECLDGDGFMRDELRKGLDDPHHANSLFGEIMMREIVKALAPESSGDSAVETSLAV